MYSPKIQSHAEDWFYHEFKKRTSAKIIPQVEVRGDNKLYRVDFIVDNRDDKIVIEVDGKEYHDEKRDYKRDRDILKNNSWIKSIIRFEAHDLVYNAPLCTLYISKFHPDFVFKTHNIQKSYYPSSAIELRDRFWSGIGERFCNVDGAIKASKSYLKTLNVYEVKFLDRIDFENSYTKTGYSVSFMNYKSFEKYQKAMDNYDDYIDNEPPNPIDFCNTKVTTVRELSNE